MRPLSNLKSLHRFIYFQYSTRTMSTDVHLRRSYLYVPSSSDRMLEKSLTSNSDVIIYDLEDSIAPSPTDKKDARNKLLRFLNRSKPLHASQIAVRINGINTPFFYEDISQIASLTSVETLILPKIHSAQDIYHVSRAIRVASGNQPREESLKIVPSIESAQALWNLGSIAGWKSEYGSEAGGKLSALLFAAEDYCADTGIIRSPSRRELLYTRSQIVIAAKAFGLEAIDMVCVNYKDTDYLKEECHDGRYLGFTGKQAIHPAQVNIIQSAFGPSPTEILRAAKIIKQMALAHASQKGAAGLEGEMIDAPMLKQAEKTLASAKAAGLDIPSVP
ncbi:citrate lyase beta subunit [Collybia nuda]|uniref:Citrate lyase beta subunit n=1 Tax=Collybia nuda TaxID=64659 RepID=A0A9P5Y8N3_9AGAR|nr:citrate lyase beta subunit [Collybia nuda]